MGKTKRSIKEPLKTKISSFKDYWVMRNYILVLAGIGFLILGYFLMTQSPWDSHISLSLSPIVLLIAYVIIIPISILYKSSNNKNNVSSEG